jgi:hypothetical protein
MILSPIMERIKELKETFSKISFHHIYRELHVKADELSKQALSRVQTGFLDTRRIRQGGKSSHH